MQPINLITIRQPHAFTQLSFRICRLHRNVLPCALKQILHRLPLRFTLPPIRLKPPLLLPPQFPSPHHPLASLLPLPHIRPIPRALVVRRRRVRVPRIRTRHPLVRIRRAANSPGAAALIHRAAGDAAGAEEPEEVRGEGEGGGEPDDGEGVRGEGEGDVVGAECGVEGADEGGVEGCGCGGGGEGEERGYLGVNACVSTCFRSRNLTRNKASREI